MESFFPLLWTADQFFVSYSVQPSFVPVKLFEVGHTVELYLKAASFKITGEFQRNHKLKKLWHDCKTDSAFMHNYEIRDTILVGDIIRKNGKGLSGDDLEHYFANQEFYCVVKYLPEIKYLGIFKDEELNKGSVWVMENLNHYWIDFLKELREYLEWPNPSYLDWIKKSIEEERIPLESRQYLNMLYE